MDKELSLDEFDALEQISQLGKNGKPSVCINRNAKRLSGIKFAAYRKDGQLELTETGRSVLFSKQCIDGLRAIVLDPAAPLSKPVLDFLTKKGYIDPGAGDLGGAQISERGLECLADLDARKK